MRPSPSARLAPSLLLLGFALVAGCARGDATVAYAPEDARELVAVSPETPGLVWPAEPTAAESHGPDTRLPDDPDPLLQELRNATESIPVLGGASSRWEHDAKVANLLTDVFETDDGAHEALGPGHRFAAGWGARLGRVVRDEQVDGLGDEAWGLEVEANGTQITYGRRANALLQLHLHCVSGCPESVWTTARAWADAIDARARELGDDG